MSCTRGTPPASNQPLTGRHARRSGRETTQDGSRVQQPDRHGINKQLGALSAVLEWAAQNGHFDSLPNWSNPTVGVKPQDRKRKERRLSYDISDLNLIFGFPVFASGERPLGGGGEAAKWLPLLALFSGARLEELGQLRTTDVGREGEISFIDINTHDDGKRVKNCHSRRKVPIHPQLVALGFLDYVEERRLQDDSRLFPELRPDDHGQVTGNWSRWWGRYARRNGLTDVRKVFHSFRHTFKSACREAALGKEIHDAITGHSSGDVGDAYGEGYPVSVLGYEIAKVSYPGLDLSHLGGLKSPGVSATKIREGFTGVGRSAFPPVPPAAA